MPAAAALDTLDLRELLAVLTAVKKGDFTARMPVDYTGIAGKIADTLNDIIEMNHQMAGEFARVATAVGKDGKMGRRAALRHASGAWEDSIESVNALISDLVQPTSEMARVIGGVARGDLSQSVPFEIEGRPLKGEFLRTAKVVNSMVDQLNSFASEVTRVAREVGTEGKLGGQAKVKGVSGTWKDLTDSVNSMASNLTAQVRNIAEVTTAVANGDLSRKITVDVRGEILELKNTINTMVDQLNAFASEVTRVAREVGTEGKLGGQAVVRGVSGTWKDLTDSVNSMGSNLTAQVRNIAEVSTAIANGDLSKKITVDVRGEILELKNTVNTMVDQLNSFASEVTRVAREVGTEGKLGGQAQVRGVAGTWKDLTDSVNSMGSNLTAQVRNIAEVATAIARGDLSKKITVDVRGEILELKNTVNTMVDQLNSFASEVTRVAREVGTEGKLGGQASVEDVAGVWRDLTDNVNSMGSNLTSQVRNIAEVSTAIARGDLSKKITVDVRGEILQLKNTMNTMVDQLNAFASEVTRVAREVGTEGKLGGQAGVQGVAGVWRDLTDNVNSMASNLTAQVRNIAEVTTAVATGDLSRKITVDVRGEILQLKITINTMVDQLNAFASEVTRVAREVGTEGKLGGQAQVKGVAGTWKDLTDNVNWMASNLTTQVRGIARVVTAAANGDLKRKLVLEAKGEIAELADTINGMTDTLAVFADQVITVAREVGIEGKLGGQARVPGASGQWRDLTDNVNQLAANLTTQVRAIAEVATAVTNGDLSRSVTVEAQGEVAALKDNINEMIRNLRDTTLKNTEQDWLKTNVARFTRLLQGQRDPLTVTKLILSELCPLIEAQHAVMYVPQAIDDDSKLRMLASYAFKERKNLANAFALGEGLVGQCALEKERILVRDVPHDYVVISSGLGEAPPYNIAVLPVLFEGEIKAVVEIASFRAFSDIHLNLLEQLTESIGIVLNTLEANLRTEDLLKQSQSLAEELQGQQEELREKNTRLEQQARSLQRSEDLLRQQQDELQNTNLELEEKARLLTSQKVEVERKNHEVERAKWQLEEKADQLTLTSRYKSEFLANMSHELRTPLNSLLILSEMLAKNESGNLSEKQVDFAKAIHGSGSDLLELINDILDLSKIESGAMQVDLSRVPLSDLADYVERTFRPIAEGKGLAFSIDVEPLLPHSVRTDARRLQQVLKNLLSNAFKFTEQGQVTLKITAARRGWSGDQLALNEADLVLAFSVTDTGIGIPSDKHQIIFEAFQQADGTTSRRFGGTGLGLSISREIATLLGGEIRLTSAPGEGSTFTLYLPAAYTPRPSGRVPSGLRLPERDVHTPEEGLVPVFAARPIETAVAQPDEVVDDRATLMPGEPVVLIVEDDPDFARVLLDLVRSLDVKGVVTSRAARALSLAREYRPLAVTLDLELPDADGWTVLDRLKQDAATRHIPVQVISVLEQDWRRAVRMGAFGYLHKPASARDLSRTMEAVIAFARRSEKRVLLVPATAERGEALISLLASGDVQAVTMTSAAAAAEAVAREPYDCVVLDAEAADVGQFRLEGLGDAGRAVPVVLHRETSTTNGFDLSAVAELAPLTEVATHEALLAETARFVHCRDAQLAPPQRALLEAAREHDPVLAGRTVLVVDDDVRNIFALTTVLENRRMNVRFAENGRDAINLVQSHPDVDVVLMDVMMPGMDGYETIQAIRGLERGRHLPVIALTAKAMPGDRENCLQAGATAYLAKPVDVEQLFSQLRVVLSR